MADVFYKDTQKSRILTYQDIVQYVNNSESYFPYYSMGDEIGFYLNLIQALAEDKKITLLDLDYSNKEIENLIDDLENLKIKEPAHKKFKSIDELITSILKSETKITLFTSGTTGPPKRITHTAKHFLQSIRMSGNHRKDIWAFAYNPTHMAGLQVFFQAFTNQNCLINLFNKSRKIVFEQLETENVTNISATPTFYRLLVPFENKFLGIQKLTLGGEKSDARLIEHLQKGFPNAKIFNIYASTEAGSLFIAKSDKFQLDQVFKDKVKIVENELVLHRSLLGQGELTNDLWYHTGDIVEVIENTPLTFRFVNRKNELINIGGNNVNPIEIENKLLDYPGIYAVKVYGKPNSVMGNLLMADVVKLDSNITDLVLKKFLSECLQTFKVPRIIKFVEKIELTRSGKVSRK